MQSSDAFTWTRHKLTVDGVALDVAAVHRDGAHVPILFLHGFGSTKEDYADIVQHRAFDYLDAPVERVGSKFSPIPFAPVMEQYVVPHAADVLAAVRRTVGKE